jgi:photosystem II stability/assembly factor-like uncharacterized protein
MKFNKMKQICEIFLLCLLVSCSQQPKKEKVNKRAPFQGIQETVLLTDSMSVRAICLDEGKVWYANDKGKIGYVHLTTNERFQQQIKDDSIKPHFRGIAKTQRDIFFLSTEKPAAIFKINKATKEISKVFTDHSSNAFFNGIQFWNNSEGIVMGDPQDGCLNVLITRDGGITWQKVSCLDLPKTEEGEAAFAASNSSLVVKNNHAWIVTGGTKARVYFSPDKGITWSVYNTPICQGNAMEGIFTADFYNDTVGIITGGNYEKQDWNENNKALTINNGQTWSLLSKGIGFGYSSCIQFVPEGGGILVVSLGPSGIYFSNDCGDVWKKISNDGSFHTFRFIDERSAVLAGKNKISKVKFL